MSKQANKQINNMKKQVIKQTIINNITRQENNQDIQKRKQAKGTRILTLQKRKHECI